MYPQWLGTMYPWMSAMCAAIAGYRRRAQIDAPPERAGRGDGTMDLSDLVKWREQIAKEVGTEQPCPWCKAPRVRRTDYIRCNPCGTNWLDSERHLPNYLNRNPAAARMDISASRRVETFAVAANWPIWEGDHPGPHPPRAPRPGLNRSQTTSHPTSPANAAPSPKNPTTTNVPWRRPFFRPVLYAPSCPSSRICAKFFNRLEIWKSARKIFPDLGRANGLSPLVYDAKQLTPMRTVFKYAVPFTSFEKVSIAMHKGAHIIHADVQDHAPMIWAEVDIKAETEVRHFLLVGTGFALPDNALLVHRGTF